MRFTAIFILLLSLCGCAAPVKKVEPDKVAIGLNESFKRIADSYEQLAQIKSAERNNYKTQSYGYDESKLPAIWLQDVVLVDDFNGDLKAFIEMISMIAGLDMPRFDSTPQRAQPVIVSVAKGKRKLISFLADVGHQAGDSAIVMPAPKLNLIVVGYQKIGIK
jgi:DotD protein